MKIEELEKVYAKLPQVAALAHEIENAATRRIFLEGLLASSAPMLFGSLAAKCKSPILFILQDAEEAGYFYHDLKQLLGPDRCCSSQAATVVPSSTDSLIRPHRSCAPR